MSEYIKREDAIKTMINYSLLNTVEAEYMFSVCKSADVVEVRHGRWIGKTYKCSLCGKWVDPLQGDADMNYCPNCGAKMDGEEENNG